MNFLLRSTLLFLLLLCACFKKIPVNENALLHQKACVESMELNDYERAKTHCELCLEFDSSMPECLNGIGIVYLAEKDEDKAINFFTKALRQDNNFSQARNNLGVIYFNRGSFFEAQKYFTRSLEIDPANQDARYNKSLSDFRIAQKYLVSDDKRAIAYLISAKTELKKLLAIEPNYHNAFRNLGLIELNLYEKSNLIAKKDALLQSAQKSFEYCLEANSENAGCYEGLGQVFGEKGEFNKAFINYFTCLSYEPNNSVCRKNIVSTYEKDTKFSLTYNKLSKSIIDEPNNGLAHQAFCSVLFANGMNTQAIKECGLALSNNPNLCQANFLLADHYAKIFDVLGAVKYCHDFLNCTAKQSGEEVLRCKEILVSLKG